MNESNDADLLARFARSGSEEAFATLVHRHIHLVHSMALRHTRDAHQAEEITQAVFIILARKASSLGTNTILTGWLYETARLTAANLRRSEIRRSLREQEAFMRSTLNEPDPPAWSELSPLLDDAMAQLAEADRNAVLLRYFENKTLPEVGQAMGLEVRTAQKRVARAVEKLRGIFAKRGVVSTAALITAAISAHSVQAAPAALATTITATAVKGATATASTLTLINETLKLMAWAKTKTAIAAGAALLLTISAVSVWVKQGDRQKSIASAGLAMDRVRSANTGLPAAQVQAKMFIMSAMAQRRIPPAAQWCETLNAKGKLWAVMPTQTAFAINSEMAGREYSRKELSSGSIPGDTVVFFETSRLGWNQSGGAELLPKDAASIAVAFADGTAQIVPSSDLAALRWKP